MIIIIIIMGDTYSFPEKTTKKTDDIGKAFYRFFFENNIREIFSEINFP